MLKQFSYLIVILIITVFSGCGGGSSAVINAPVPTGTVSPSQEEFYFTNPSSGAKLWGKVYYPPVTGQKYPGLVIVPGGLGFGSNLDNTPKGKLSDYAKEGFVVMVFDPDGRGKSQGQENYNGIIHQDGLNELLKKLVNDPYVDTSNIGVYTSSLGITLGAGALGRYPDNPTVHYLIDGEGPSDRFYITKFNDPNFLKMFAGHTTDDVEWWSEREAYRSIQTYGGMYVRLQTSMDHVHRENKGHALMMIENATGKQYGGKGFCLWTRINGEENPENKVFSEKNPPKWLTPGSLHTVDIEFMKEMRDKVSSML